MPGALAYLDGGSASLIVLALVVPLIFFIWGLVDAIQRGQTGWWVGMIVGWIFALGWLVAIIYLLAVRPGLKREPADQGPAPG
ncbi:MAG: hypothetical protein M5U31_05835 [Acidimicrobiia bacterium]|nr:hypothetical protein [Acidimicrobiia bacterium]